ncbi:EcsC family protein [Nocardioides pacificus]
MSVKSNVSRALLPKAAQMAPGLSSGFAREALNRAIRGVGPLPPAAEAADKQLAEQKGDAKLAIREVIENHVRYAGAQGFVTNLGGLVTAAVTIPVNVTGLALVQCRMIAGIGHLRGYDLEDPRVRNALLVTLLGEDEVEKLLKKRKIPAPPMALATAPTHDPALDRLVSGEVAAAMLGKVAGKQVVTTVGRRVPIVGGLVGAGSDGWSTWQIGRYAERELLPRARR